MNNKSDESRKQGKACRGGSRVSDMLFWQVPCGTNLGVAIVKLPWQSVVLVPAGTLLHILRPSRDGSGWLKFQ